MKSKLFLSATLITLDMYAVPDGRDLIERIESRNGILTIEHAERMGVGSREYQLVRL